MEPQAEIQKTHQGILGERKLKAKTSGQLIIKLKITPRNSTKYLLIKIKLITTKSY